MKKTLAVLVLSTLAPIAVAPVASARTVIVEHGHRHHPHFFGRPFHRHHDRTVIIHRR